ncbi:MAG: ECF transporter S component [Promethearchaeota archaeon]
MELNTEIEKTCETVEVTNTEQEKTNHSIWLERSSFRIALISSFTALTIVLGYFLIHIPNIELFTLLIFLSGFTLGKRDGIIVGFLSSFIFCYFNLYGSSPLPLLIFQLIHYSLTGLLGGSIKSFSQKRINFKDGEDFYKFSFMVLFGLIGALITTNFQIISSIIHVLSFLGTISEFLPYFLSGIAFTAIHIIGNTLGFIFILPGLIQLINKLLN